MERPGLATAATVRGSARLVAARRSALTAGCRGAVADLLPAGHPLLRPGEPDLVGLFVDSLLQAMLDDREDAEDVESSWQRLGGLFSGLRVTESDWQTLGHGLLRAVRQISGDSWTTSVSSGWAAYHLWMTHHLARGAAAGAVEEGVRFDDRPRSRRQPRGPSRPDPRPGPFQAWTQGWN